MTKGRQYWIFEDNRISIESDGSTYPRNISTLGLPSDIDHIDAAFLWSYNRQAYLVSSNLYWALDERWNRVNTYDYPRDMIMWQGIQVPLDDAFVDLSGRITNFIHEKNIHFSFFFSNKRFNIFLQRPGFLAFKRYKYGISIELSSFDKYGMALLWQASIIIIGIHSIDFDFVISRSVHSLEIFALSISNILFLYLFFFKSPFFSKTRLALCLIYSFVCVCHCQQNTRKCRFSQVTKCWTKSFRNTKNKSCDLEKWTLHQKPNYHSLYSRFLFRFCFSFIFLFCLIFVYFICFFTQQSSRL